jgi:voltage-dependent potassium channel beta subunit
MQYRKLGQAGIKVSTISLGGWINYGEGKVAQDAARHVVIRAYEQGINFFDIADIYGKGEAEKQMGTVLQMFPRHTLVISTKVYWPMSDDVNDQGLSRKHIFESIHKSLKRIGTDYVDIYFCHRPDDETPMLETARAMHDLVTQGKVLYWGTSEWSGEQLAAMHEICEKHNLHAPITEQPQYSMLHRERVETNVMPVSKSKGMGLVVWSPLAMGMLTGKYDDGIDKDSRFSREEWAKERFMTQANVERVKTLKAVADDLKLTRAQLALAWTLRDQGVSSAIIGATKVSQVDDNVRASGAKLPAEALKVIEEILA